MTYRLTLRHKRLKQRKPYPHLICCASMIALSLAGCSQHVVKPKAETNINDNVPGESTSSEIKSRVFHVSRNGLRKRLGGQAVATKAKYATLWERLFALYNLPQVEHEEINRELNWFVSHPTLIERVQSRAEPFLYNIVRQFEKHDVPGELALLPVIESAFQPHAISPANAAGIWQFIPSTGRNYGLRKNRSYDGRRDVYASTRAAIKYLKKLHNDFDGDWLLAMAAYNCGEGAVARAIQRNAARNLPTDFWSLDLPQETRGYVPRLLAVAKLFAEADRYGIDLRDIPNRALFKTVRVTSPVDLAMAADAAEISLDKMHELNPGFKSQIANVEGNYILFVPAEKYRSFKEQLPRLASTVQHTGFENPADRLEENAIEETSGGGVSDRKQEEGETSVVVKEKKSRELAHEASRRSGGNELDSHHEAKTEAKIAHRIRDEIPVETSSRSSKKAGYLVQGGDTLYSIARKHSVDVEQLRKWNHLKGREIQSGQTLVVWDKDAAKKLTAAASGIKASQSIKYTVRQGDSLFGISKKFNVSVSDLRKWNGTKVDKHFKPGTNLTVSTDKD